MEINKIYNEDCLEGMKRIADGSVDMILCDLPYGTTQCKWDTVIPFEPLWKQYRRVIKPNGAIVLTASQPFTSALVMSNTKMFKYCWVWEKGKSSNFVHAKNMPIKQHEDICVFSLAPIGHRSQLGNKRMEYNPQGLIKVNARWHRPKEYETDLIWNRVTNSDFSKLKVDTKILVNGKPAYFSYYNEVSGKVYYFADGLSNWTAPIFHSKPIVDICDPEDVEVIEEFD